MANPSTTGPSGAGTEVLRRMHEIASAGSHSFPAVPTDHIWTILSIIVASSSATNSVGIIVNTDGSNDCNIITWGGDTTIPTNETFVWNDKFVITASDVLKVCFGGSDADIYVTYIDQEF